MACLKKNVVDLALLDAALPDIDGFHICQKIRESYYFSRHYADGAKIADTDKIMGLYQWRDDYITKPFNPLEVGSGQDPASLSALQSPAHRAAAGKERA